MAPSTDRILATSRACDFTAHIRDRSAQVRGAASQQLPLDLGMYSRRASFVAADPQSSTPAIRGHARVIRPLPDAVTEDADAELRDDVVGQRRAELVLRAECVTSGRCDDGADRAVALGGR